MKETLVLFVGILTLGCSFSNKEYKELFNEKAKLESNIKMYSTLWEKVINERKIDLINSDYYDAQVSLITSSNLVIGIDSVKVHYNNFLTGFSDAKFSIIDIYGQGNQITKHWRFEGTHDGIFFEIPPTDNKVDLYGVTLVLMREGKVFQEQDFYDNNLFLKQLGFVE